jgi:hypothetical protein
MPYDLLNLTTTRIEHMSPNATYYNNVLSLGATGVDNGAGGGFEKIVGDHAIKLNGRTYHYLPKTGGSGGLQYFTFDAMASLHSHGTSLNKNTTRGEHIKATYLRRMDKTTCLTNLPVSLITSATSIIAGLVCNY